MTQGKVVPLNPPIIKRGYIIKKLILTILIFALATALFAREDVVFHNIPWGTSIEDFTAKYGKPVHRDEVNGLSSLIYEGVIVSGYTTYMLAYFSREGLQGGTYYFLTYSLEELMKCYSTLQSELLEKFGPTMLCDPIIREMRPYETSWRFDSGYVYLKVNTRVNEPIMLWYSSPKLTRQILGS